MYRNYDADSFDEEEILEELSHHRIDIFDEMCYVIWAIAVFVWYKALVFRNLPGMSYKHSVLVLVIIVLVVHILGFLTADKYGQLPGCIVFFNAIGFGIYTVLSYHRIFPWHVRVLVLLTGIVIIGGWLIFLLAGEKYWKKRLFVLWARNIAGLFLGGFLTCISVQSILYGTIYNAGVTVLGQAPKLEISEEEWQEMAITKKADLLQQHVIVYQQEHNMEDVILQVAISNLEEDVTASYGSETQLIELSADWLESGPKYENARTVINFLCQKAEALEEEYIRREWE